nr:hypothetical protein [Tanacetum cinerariifolium]
VSYHKLYDILKQHQHEVNEIQAKKIARVANPLALVAQQQQVYHPHTHPTHFNQNSSTRTHQAATRHRGKAVVNSHQPIYDQEPSMVDDDEDTHVARKCQKPKKAKDAAYHREKMLLYKQEEAGIQLNVEQADWKDDTDDESDDQELEAHYMYMAKLQQIDQNDEDVDLAKEHFKNKNKSLTEANNKLSVENDQLYADYKKSKAELQRRNSVEYASEMKLECAKAKGDLFSYKMEYE